MRIVIDLQGAQNENRFRGIGRYATAFSLAMARNAGQHEIWLVLNGAFAQSLAEIRQTFSDVIPRHRIRTFMVPTPALEIDPTNAWRTRAAEIVREQCIARLRPDLVLVTSMFEGLFDSAVSSIGALSSNLNTAVILYDLIPFHNPGTYLPTSAHRQHYDRKIASLKKADLLLAISDFSRQDAIDSLELAPDRVVSIAAAIDTRFKPYPYSLAETAALQRRFGISRKMVMYAPGGFDSRKNFEGLIQAYALLSMQLRASHQLVIVSKISAEQQVNLHHLREMAKLGEDELVLTGYVSDDELVALYNLATLFVFPSKFEGFGLPVLEAMACGAPTIGANTTSIPEVIGWESALFDPHSVNSISEKMTTILSDENLRMKLREHGLQQAKKFSWDSCAQKAIAAIEAREFSCQETAIESDFSTDTTLAAIANIRTPVTPIDGDLLAVANAMSFNTGSELPRQILVDVSVIVLKDAKSGIQRVVRSILLALLEKVPKGYVVRPIYFDGERYVHARVFLAGFLGTPVNNEIDEIAEFNQDDIYLGLDLNAHLASRLHALHLLHQQIGISLYFVVYDIILMQRPDWWPEGVAAVFHEWLRSITQVATGLVCISHAVAVDVAQWILENPPVRPDAATISSFHLGADISNSFPSKGLAANAHVVLDRLKSLPSFLMVGTIEPRKGHAQTLAAFELLWERGVDVNLVIVGAGGWLVNDLVHRLNHHPEKSRHLFWLEGISDEYLEKVYAASTCLIAASQAEGFGLPLIEAAQHKRPIIARDIPVFREVAGDHAVYFEGLEAVSLADTVEEWLTLNAQGLAPQSDNLPWLTWEQSVMQLLDRILPNERLA